MSKQFKVAVNTGKESENTLLDVPPKAGANGQPLRIKATPGAKYQLQEVSDTGKSSGKPVGPDFVKTRRVGKNLQILLEGSTEADVIIEDYYDVFVDGYNGLVGQAENGSFYEYIPEDPDTAGLVGSLRDGGQAVNAALGGAEVQGAGAAIGLLAFNPLLGALGLLGAGAAAVAAANTTGTTGTGTGTGTTPTGTTTGALTATAPNDSGIIGDNLTNDRTPTLSGTVPTGSSASVTINGQTFPVTVNPDGTWTFTQPNNLPDGTYYPVLSVTTNGVTTQTNITPFTIDTTPPTVAVTSSAAALAANETANITFTLSEPSTDFALDDIAVTGGQLSNLVQSATDPKIYTARFTPTAGTTPGTATISVASDKFADAAANRNTDGAEPNNTVTIRTNATVTGALTPTAPNDSGTVGDNLTNDTTPALSGKVPAGATATVTLNGQTYPATVNPDGTWTAQVPETGKLPDGTYTPQLNVTSGGVTTTTPITPFTIDTVPAKVAVTSNTNTLGSGQTANVTFTLTEPVNDFTADDVVVTGGTLGPLTKSPTDPKIYTATFTPSNTGTTASISVPSDKFADAAGNRNTDGAEPDNTVTLTTNAPISGQLAPVSDNTVGTPNDQKTNDPTPNLIGKVPAGSSATITLNGQTSPVTVAPDGTWTFTQPTNLPDGTYTPQLNVTTGSVTTSQNITPFTVDTVAPTVAITSSVNTSTTPLSAGQSTVLSFTVSEATTNLTDADLAVVGGTLGPLQQSATNPLLYTATFTATPGITANTTASVSLDSDKFSDAAGNLNKDGAEANNTWSTSVTPTTNPTPNPNGVKTALSINPIATDNVLLANEGTATTYPVTGKVTGAFAAGDIVNIALNGKNYPTAVAADGSFSVTVSMADLKADPDTKVEGSITGTGGDTATAAQDYTVETGNTATQTALSIDPVTADNLLNATESTNPVAITGKVTGRFAAGDTVTLTVNGKTFTGAAAANGNFSINVPGADLKADSDTTVDGRVTGTGGSTANAIQNYALSDSSTVSPSLKTALSIDPILGDNVISATEGNANSYTVTGKVTGTFAPGDIVEVKLNDKTYAAAVAADGSYSVAVPMSALKADPDTKIEASITGTGGDPATAAQDYTVETSNTPTQTSLTINPVTADNILGSTESTGNIPITGKVNGKFSTGDTVTLSVNGKTFIGTAAADGSYSIAVPAADLLADPDTQVDGTVTGAGGTLARAIQDYGVDANVNPVNPSVKTALSINPILGDNVISTAEGNANNYTVTGKVTGAFKEGDLVELQLNNKTYATTVAADGSYSVPVPMADLKADADTKIEARITGTGGDTATAAQDYTVEGNTNSGRTTLSIDPVTADNVINNTESTTTATNVTGKVSGTFAAGDTVTLTVNGKPFTGTAAANGNFSISVPTADLVADKDTTVEGTVTGTGGTTANAIQDYGLNTDGGTNPVDTTPPTIAITSNQASLATGQQATITFTLSEASTDFVWNGTTGDINVTGGTLGALTQSTSNPLVYTAVFTPANNSTTNGVISVASDRFSDAAGNFNKDGADANNTVTLSVNTTTTAPSLVLTNDTAEVGEAGGVTNQTAGTALTSTTSGVTVTNVLSNDTGNTPKVTGIQAASATNATTVSSTGNTSVTGQFGTLSIAENGTYSYTVSNANATVQGLRTSANTLSDVFTYTANDGTGPKTANLVVTIKGTNDAPTVVVQEADKTGTVGTALTAFNVANNFADVDTAANGETATLSATLANGSALPSWLSFNAATGAFSGTPTAPGTTSVTVTRTDAAGASVSDNFDIVVTAVTDTTPPTIAITSNQANLSTGQQATVTFTLSEASNDFTWDGSTGDITVTGGTLGAITKSTANPLVYTAVFTPATNSTTNAVISVASDKFKDAAGNFNKDGADANNTVTMTVNTTTAAPSLVLTNDTATVGEAGGITNQTVGSALTSTTSGVSVTNVLSNDTGNTPKVTGIQPNNSNTVSNVSGSNPTTINGQFGTLTIAENGTYTYTVNNSNATVQALRTGSQTLSDVFNYTANDGTGAKTANLVITITGTNDAPTLTTAVADKTGSVGAALSPFSVANNFNDVDTAANGETATLTTSTLPSWLKFDAATGTFSGTPTAAGTTSVTVTRTDAAGASVSDTFDIVVTPTGTPTGALTPTAPNDSGTLGDNKTNDKTPTLSGTVPAGSSATITVNGQTYPVTVAPDGSWTFTQPTDLPDGTYTPQLNVTTGGVTTTTPITPFTIDTATRVDITNPGKAGGTDPISGTAEPGDTVVVKDASGKVIGTTTADNNGNWSLTPTSAPSAGPITATATDAAGNTATDTDTPISPSVKTALSIDPITNDNIVTAAEGGATSYTVTGKVTGTFAAGDTVNLSLNGKIYPAIVAADGSYSVPVAMSDLKADPDTKIEGTVTGTGGQLATAAQDYTVEATNTPTQTTLSIDKVTADNIIGSTESTGNIPVTGKVAGKFATGDTVTLTVNGKTYTGPAAADGSFSIPVPAADLLADPDTQVDGNVTGTGGTLAKAMQDYGVDANINPVTPSVKTALTITPITGDNIITAAEGGAANYVVTGKVTGTFAAGDTVNLMLNGKTYATLVAADGSYSVPVPMSDLKADPDTKIEGTVVGTGGDTATAAQDYQVETSATAGTLKALSIDPVTLDNILSAAEKAGTVPVTGKVTGPFTPGETVTLSVNGKTFTGTVAANGAYSIPVPGTDLAADPDTQVDGSVTGASAMQNYGVDTSNNPAPQAVADTNTVTEAGGTLNGTTFADPTGNVLTNDTTAGAVKTVYEVLTSTTPATSKVLTAGVSNSITGNYGTLFIKTDGSYSYTPNNAAPAVEALNIGSTPLTETFTYTLKDGSGASATTTLKINITGTDDAPVVSVKESNQSATIGTPFSYTVPVNTFSDVDDAVSTLSYSATLAGGANLPDWLSFNPTTRTFSGTPPAGTPAQVLTLAVTATDPGKLSATDTFTLNVSSNHAPTASPITAPQAITELTDASAQNIAPITGTVSVNDVDTGNTLTASTTTATARWSGGTSLPTGVNVSALVAANALSFGAGVTPNGTATNLSWTYDPQAANLDWLPKDQTLTITYPVTISDGQGGTATQNLVITITGTNDAPVATAISQQYNKGAAAASINLLANATDPDLGETTSLVIDPSSITYAVTTNSSNGSAQAASATVPQGVTLDATKGTLSIDPTHPIFSTIAAGQNETIVATYKVKDVNGAWTTTTATLVVNGAGTNAVIASDDTATATEAGGTNNNTAGTNPSGNLLTNDSNVVGTKAVLDATGAGALTPVASTGSTTIAGTYGTLILAANGTYTYNVTNSNETVQALRTSTDKLTDTFSYTLTDGQDHTSTAKLIVTLQGANDAPVAVADTASATEKGGVGNATTGVDPTGNVLSNDKDLDTGDTQTVTLVKATNGGDYNIGTTSTPVTGVYGALNISADGKYTYVVDNSNPIVQALKDANATVNDVFTYTVRDTDGLTSTATLTVTVHGANDAPIVSTISTPASIAELPDASTQNIAPISGTVTVNDIDTGNVITASAGNATASWSGGTSLPTGVNVSALVAANALSFGAGVTPNGTATNLSWTYDPQAANLDWLPKDQTLTITYPVTISDGQGGTATQNLVITITGTNDAPVASPIYQTYNKGAAAAEVGLLTNATDPDLGETTSLVIDPSSITYAVTTNSPNGSTQSASSNAPQGVSFDASTGKIRIDPTHAIFSTIAAGQNETIVVSYRVKDRHGDYVTTTATLVVNGSGSNAPIASNDTATATEAGGALNGTLGTNPTGNLLSNDSVVAGSAKTVQDASGSTGLTTVAATGTTNITGAYGTLVLAADGSYTYNVDNTKDPVQALRTSSNTLTDTFTYTLKDGAGSTSTAKLVVTVQGANDAPTALNDTDSATEAGTNTTGVNPSGFVLTNDKDVDDGDTKTVSQIQGVGTAVPVSASTTSTSGATTANGTYGQLKIGADGSYTYTVDNTNTTVQALKDFNATVNDVFTYTVTDAAGLTSTATLTITVHGANDAVTASAIASPTAIVELDNASAQDIAPINGTVSVNDPDSGNVITASAGTATASWSGGTSLPTGVNVSALVAANALSFGAGVTPNGTATNLSWTYDPQAANLDWLPKDQTLTITYPVTISDGQGGTATQNLVITITGTNDAPVATAITKAYTKGAAAATVNLLSTATDPDLGETAALVVDPNTPVTYVVTTTSSNGSAQASSTATPAGVKLNADGTLSIDPSDPIFSTIFAGENETIVATYKVKDTKGTFVTTTATLIVNGTGSGLPIGSNDVAVATEAGGTSNNTAGTNPTGNLVTNDTTFTGTKLVQNATGAATLTNVASTGTTNIVGAYGTLVLAADGTYTYNVDNTKNAVQALRTTADKLTDTFTYTLTDGQGRTSTAQLIVTVQGANDAPKAQADTASATEAGGTANTTAGSTATGNVLANDTDIDNGDTKTVSQATGTGSAVSIATGTTSNTVATTIAGAYGSLKLGADGSYTYEVNNTNNTVQALKSSADTLTDTFTYTVQDAAGLTDTATLTVTVRGANDAPVVGTNNVVSNATNLVPTQFGTAFSFSDVDVSTGVMTLTLSSSDTDGKITVAPGASGATVTAGNGSNNVTVSGTLAQLQALTSSASNFTFVNSDSYTTNHNVTITATLNDNGNLGNVASPLTGSGAITFAVAPNPNVNARIDITAITNDSGVSATDYNTNDNTLVYSGTVSNFTANGNRVKLELLKTKNADGTAVTGDPILVDSTTVDPVGGTWTWNKETSPATDGTYQLRATIVDANGNRVNPTSQVGSNTGTQDVQTIVIDTNTPEVDPNRTATIDIVTLVDAATDSKDTGTSATDFITSDQTLSYKGTISTAKGWDSTQGDLVKLVLRDANNNIVATQYVTPVKTSTGASWSWDDTGVTRNANTTYTLEASIVDTAGNRVNKTEPVNGTGGGIDTQLITIDTQAPTQKAYVDSMTKDSGVTTTADINNNWLTNDTSAGRLVSGFLDAPLKAGEVVNVYANDALLGTATVAPGGTTWNFTDIQGYNASWTYSARVADAAGLTGEATKVTVSLDMPEDAPVITDVFDTTNTSVANGGATSNLLSTIKGTGIPGNTVYLYDNNYNTLVGTAVVNNNGDWSVTSLTGTFSGSNTFAAKQVDAQANHSAFSGLWTVTAPAANLNANGDFSAGNVNFTTDVDAIPTTPNVGYDDTAYIWGGNRIGVIDLQSTYQPNYNTTNQGPAVSGAPVIQVSAGALSAPTAATGWAHGTWTQSVFAFDLTNMYTSAWKTFGSLASGKVLAGSADYLKDSSGANTSATNLGDLWRSTTQVEAGKTYEFSFVYWNTVAKNGNTAGFMDVMIDGQKAMTTTNSTTGKVTIQYTAPKTGSIDLALQTWSTIVSSDFVLDNINFTPVAPANTTGFIQPTINPDTLSYTAGALDALASNDTITVANADLQAKLNAGGVINGGSGIDTLRLAAGTQLNLESLTSNQTVKPIEQVEIFTMQGGNSALTLSANNVLSLGGSNASTMAPFTFGSTNQTASGSTQPTGSTTSTGKVQFVVNGQQGDTLNLDVLANDGVISTYGASAGLLGNTGLAGRWDYKGLFSISASTSPDNIAHTYKVYDHSLSGAQVLVDSAVTVNTITPITITAISEDRGTSNTDFVTSDETLTYTGALPAAYNGVSERVWVEVLNSANTRVSSGFATVNGTTWTWVDPTTQPAGNYTIRSTIVGLSNTTPLTSIYGPGAVATHDMTIELTPPQVAISRTDGLNTTVGTQGTQLTFTLSEASKDFTWNGTSGDIEVSGGTLSALQATSNPLVYTATFTPAANATGTGYVRIASNKFSDAAGNLNQDTYANPATAPQVYQANNQQAIPYDTLPPTQTVTFSSMTKDSGVSSGNANWTTSDTSAGRLVSGTIDQVLNAGEVIQVYSNGNPIGTATVAPGGKTWAITDTNGYGTQASWTYTAKVVDAYGNSKATLALSETQVVITNLEESAPTITSVINTAGASIANEGTTTNAFSAVSGNGIAGNTIYLYDNTYTNLVGSAVVSQSGFWTISPISGAYIGKNSFAATQLDPHGNQSKLSNLWTVTSSGVINGNGDFSLGNTGFTNQLNEVASQPINGATDQYTIMTVEQANINQTPMTTKATTSTKSSTAYGGGVGSWSKVYLGGDVAATTGNPNGAMSGNVMQGQVSGGTKQIWGTTADVVKGQTYTFVFDYSMQSFDTAKAKVVIDGNEILFMSTIHESGRFTATYTATETKTIDFSIVGFNAGASGGDFVLDNLNFAPTAPAAPVNTLVAGGDVGATPSLDNLTYVGGALNALESNDNIIVATPSDLQSILEKGGYINGSAGVDTLKLAAGTVLDLDAITINQTVQPIQQVEVFQLNGSSKLTLSANDVLSLGGSNATTMSSFRFASTSGGAASANSDGKVQFVVNGLSNDTVILNKLANDGVPSNGVLGNTGLAGSWTDMGTTTIDGVTYKVYNHSTTQAQVLISGANVVTPETTQTVTITRADTNNATVSYIEEFTASTGTSTLNTLGSKVTTEAWTVELVDILSAKAPVSELKLTTGVATNYSTQIGADGLLQLNEPATTTTYEPRLATFTSKLGAFTAISFKFTDLWYSDVGQENDGSLIKFYDANGDLVASKTLTTSTAPGVFSYTLPAGVSASSFTIRTNTNDKWAMDELSMTPASTTYLAHTSATVDATPLLTGTYTTNLNAGDVIKVYDETGKLQGTAAVDAATKTWTLQLDTPQALGTHTYTAKIESSANATVATSNNYSLNMLATALNINSISQDTGVAGDFITSDNQLIYNGQLPAPLATGEKVLVEILSANGTSVISSGTVIPAVNSTTWTWDQSGATALANGDYLIRATIVSGPSNTPVASYGNQGTDTQPMTVFLNHAPIMTDTDSLLPNPFGVSIAAGTVLNTTFTDTATVDVTRTSATGTLSYHGGEVVYNPDGKTRINLATYEAAYDERVSYAFTQPVAGIKINFEDFTPGDTMQVKVNGQLITFTTAMQGGTTSVAMPNATGDTLVGTYRSVGGLGVNQFTLTILPSDVPGGLINSIEILGKSNSSGGGFWMYAPSSVGEAYTTKTVAQLFGNVYYDQDNHEMKGVAINSAGTSTDLSNKGSYSYSTNGGVSWTTLAAGLSDTNAVFLKLTDLLRFVPVSGTTAVKQDLTARVVDTSGETGSANLTSGNTVDVSNNGGSTAFSVKTITLNANTTAPVVLDLNGDGTVNYNQIQMDMNADGVLDTTAWTGAQDGLLVRDSLGDGTVRNTSQFAFARHSGETDLQGLAAQFDSNHDGVLNAQDAQFAEFAVWQDHNQNGVSDAGEVRHLSDLGIQAIQLTSDGVVRTPATGVTEAGHTTALRADGSTLLVADASFAYTPGTAEATQTAQASTADLPTPTHCDEPWIEAAQTALGTGVFSLDTTEWQNKPYALSAEQLAELNLPVPTSAQAADAMQFMLQAADVLLHSLDTTTVQQAVQTASDSLLNLSNLLGTEAATAFAQQCLTTLGHHPDTTLQLLIDTHMQTMSA